MSGPTDDKHIGAFERACRSHCTAAGIEPDAELWQALPGLTHSPFRLSMLAGRAWMMFREAAWQGVDSGAPHLAVAASEDQP